MDVNCPFCGETKGKMNVNLQKNVFRCNPVSYTHLHDSENSASLFNGIVRKLFGYFGGVKIILVFFLEPASLFLTLLSVCAVSYTHLRSYWLYPPLHF